MKLVQRYLAYKSFDVKEDRRQDNTFIKQDRRQNNVPVDLDRRSGLDRRAQTKLDPIIKRDYAWCAAMIPLARKPFEAVFDFKRGDWFKGLGMAFRSLNEGKGDLEGFKSFFKKDPKTLGYQYPFWFAKGNLIDNTWLGNVLKPFDKVIFEYNKVQKTLAKIGLKGYEYSEKGYRFTGKPIAKTLAISLTRIPIIGVYLFGTMEACNVIKAENKLRESQKSTFKIFSIMSLTALFGAIGSRKCKGVEWSGMGIGVLLGKYLTDMLFPKPKKINTNI